MKLGAIRVLVLYDHRRPRIVHATGEVMLRAAAAALVTDLLEASEYDDAAVAAAAKRSLELYARGAHDQPYEFLLWHSAQRIGYKIDLRHIEEP